MGREISLEGFREAPGVSNVLPQIIAPSLHVLHQFVLVFLILKVCRVLYPAFNLCRKVVITVISNQLISTYIRHICAPVHVLLQYI